ncbi:MAG: DoxX family protein [Panacibacter sp.]
MNLLHQIDGWSVKHHPKWLVALRAALGIVLFIKGISFIKNSTLLPQLIEKTALADQVRWLGDFILWAHLFGGCLILIGLFTRLAVLLQIPILIGAVFFINSNRNIFTGDSDLLFSVIILLLLIFFLVEGSGTFSFDNYLKSRRNK